jgi:hypothetical protein
MINKKNVAIMAVGQFINSNIINRFCDCINKSKPSVSYDIHILKTTDPSQRPDFFNKSKILNQGIKTLCTEKYEVVIQTDIDLIVPPKIIDKSFEVARIENTCFHANHRRIDVDKILTFPTLPDKYNEMNWDSFLLYFPEPSNGCWNAMRSSSWWNTGGYNENCVNWSREDDDLARRARKFGGIKFIMSNEYALIHVNHAQRNFANVVHNKFVIQDALSKGKINWLT